MRNICLSVFRFYLYFFIIFLSFSTSPANDVPTETEEESLESLKIKSKTELCSADYYINKGNEEKDRERKDIGLGEQIKLLLVGKPKGNIQKLKWGIDGNGFEQKSAEELEGSLLITLTAKKNLTRGLN